MAGNSRTVELNINKIRERIFDLRMAKAESLELQVLARAKIRITLLDDYLSVDYLMDIYVNETLYKDVVDSCKIEYFEEVIQEAVNKELKNYREHQNERIRKVKILKNKDTEECNNAIEPTKEMLDNLQNYLDNISKVEKKEVNEAKPSKSKQQKDNEEKKVFIVHGHDDKALREMGSLLKDLKISYTILKDIDARSKTIIEALEKEIAESSLVIVLMTPDDVGKLKKSEEPNFRSRQNVILEMGMAIGALGRDRMFLLKKGELEMPSDILGLQFHKYEKHVIEKVKMLVNRLKNSGFEISNEDYIELLERA